MEKNIGKRTCMKKLIDNLHGSFWNGVDKSIYDENGIVLQTFDHDIKTRAAKEAKLNLLNYFLQNIHEDYLVLFEDDIVLHKDFYQYYQNVINFANNNKFKLIYMGVSCVIPNEQKTENFNIHLLPEAGYRFSGAYGVIIHRSVMQTIILRSNDPLLYKRPFDVYSLGHIQIRHPEECFVCSPQIVIPLINMSDIRDPRSQNILWSYEHMDKSVYLFQPSLPLFVLTDDNLTKVKQFIIVLGMFVPYVHPIFVHKNNNQQFKEKYENIYDLISVDDFNDTNYLESSEKYAITNIYVNWTKNIENVFDTTDNIEYKIDICSRCHKNKQNESIDKTILNNLIIIKNKSCEKKYLYNEKIFYVYNCIENNDKWHIQ